MPSEIERSMAALVNDIIHPLYWANLLKAYLYYSPIDIDPKDRLFDLRFL
ncbi:MAG: hypothetical protein RMJ31_01495 [Nitrososphaerota archaeon]|nr:hypothetical protein [Nitrososphaerota archaeon]